MDFLQEDWNACLCYGRQGGCNRGRIAVQVWKWINLETEGGIRRSTHVSKTCQLLLCMSNHPAYCKTAARTGGQERAFKSKHYLRRVCPSVLFSSCVELCSRQMGLREKLIMGSCTEMLLHVPVSVKLGHEWHALYLKPVHIYDHFGC
jgi:hypothetical protein